MAQKIGRKLRRKARGAMNRVAKVGYLARTMGRRFIRLVMSPMQVRVVAENAHDGAEWRRHKGVTHANDIDMQINAYASATSVNVGESINFHVTTAATDRYRVAIFRMGYYGGMGARKLMESPELVGVRQPDPDIDPNTGLITCKWSPSWTLEVPNKWTSGTYMAVFTTSSGWRSFTPFVVRDENRKAKLCVVMSFTTYQAYNFWPMDGERGKNLYYGFYPAESGRKDHDYRAFKVSFDRPYQREGVPSRFDFDLDFIQWAERQGYDLTYTSSIDLHHGNIDPSKYSALVFPGHDEYWTGAMRDVAQAAVDGGTSLVFLTANNLYWHIRIEASPDGRADRVVACFKGSVDFDSQADERGTTVQWRQNRPAPDDAEQRLLGIQYNGILPKPLPLIVESAEHWFWAGTGVKNGDRIEQVVGGEADGYMAEFPSPPGVTQTLLAATPYRLSNGDEMVQNTSVYETANGAIVFAAGSLDWPAALNRKGRADRRIQKATGNLFHRILWHR